MTKTGKSKLGTAKKYYFIEAKGKSMKGTITCGSEEGYDGGQRFSMGRLISALNKINQDFVSENISPIPCIVQEGTLLGRSDSGQYQEQVYTLNFSWSPRLATPKKERFYETLMKYANRIGNSMKQDRIYVEYDGKTTVLKKKSQLKSLEQTLE